MKLNSHDDLSPQPQPLTMDERPTHEEFRFISQEVYVINFLNYGYRISYDKSRPTLIVIRISGKLNEDQEKRKYSSLAPLIKCSTLRLSV